jgi:hypothetical protein
MTGRLRAGPAGCHRPDGGAARAAAAAAVLAADLPWHAGHRPCPARDTGPGPATAVLTGRLRASPADCHLPDGDAAPAAGAAAVLAADPRWHLGRGLCPGTAHPPAVPVPALGPRC